MSSEPQIEIQERSRSLRDILHILFRHDGKIIVFFTVVVALTLLATVFMPNIYRSEAQLMLRLGRENLTLDPTVTVRQTVGIMQTRENELLSELRVLRSRELKEQLVDQIGLEAFQGDGEEGEASDDGGGLLTQLNIATKLDPREQAIVTLERGLDIDVVDDSTILSIAFENKDKEFARLVVQTLVDLYQEKHISIHRTAGSFAFFDAQAKSMKQQLTDLDEELGRLKTSAGLSSLPDQRRVLTDRLDAVEQKKNEVEATLAVSQARVNSLQATLDATPQKLVLAEATGFSNPAAAAMREQLYLLKIREKDLSSKYKENSLPVQAIREQIAKAEQLLSGEEPSLSQVTTGVNEAFTQLQIQLFEERARLASLQAQRTEVLEQRAEVQQLLKETNDNDVKIVRLERERLITDLNYKRYAQKLEDARIDNALESEKISNLRVVQAATAPIDPVAPNKLRNLLLGLALAFLGSIGLALGCEYFDHTLKSPEDVRKHLDLAVLTSIPRTLKSHVAETKERVQIRENGKVTYRKERRWRIPYKLRERIADLRESLLLKTNGDKTGRIFGVVGSQRGEGSTTVAVNLATSLASRAEGKILVVDLNCAEPTMPRMFRHEPAAGWSDDLATRSEGFTSIRSTPINNLEYLPVGHAADSMEINWDEVREKLANLSQGYHTVVLDLPPVNEASGSLGVARIGHAVALVVESERARWEVAHRALERLELGGAQIAGVVLNKRRFPIPQWLYRWL